MKRTIPALLLVLCLLTGCGGSAPMNNMASDSAVSESISGGMGMDNGYVDKGDYDYGWAEDKAEAPSAPNAAPDNAAENPLQNAKIIYTADVTLETRDFDAANEAVAALVKSMGGYFESREVNQGGTYRSVYCTIRVPASRFQEFLEEAGAMAHMTYRNEYSKNVSEAYYDLEARLTTQRTKLERLQQLLAEAKNMADIITIESAISETELQIEYLTGSLRSYDSLIDFSTIHLSLREVYRLSNEEVTPVTFGDRLATAFKRGLEQGVDNLEDFVIFVARNWLTLIVYAAIIAAAIVLIRRKRRNRVAGKKSLFRKADAEQTDSSAEQ